MPANVLSCVAMAVVTLSVVSAKVAAQRPTTSRPAASSPADPLKSPGPFEVQTQRLDWKDDQRERVIPVKLYFPRTGKGPFGVVIFSHALGGSRESYAFLGRHWASHGYVCIHLQHEGSDDGVWREQTNRAGQMSRAAKDPRNAVNRSKDVSFAIDQLKLIQAQEGPLRGRMDLNRIGAAGHSFGAMTALALVGERGGRASNDDALVDARIKAAIYMSPPVPVHRGRFDEVYGEIRVPGLHMTGTLDETRTGKTKADDRRIPYDHIDQADQYLLTLAGGTHDVFTGRGLPATAGRREADAQAAAQEVILAVSTAFLDAYLKGDAQAKIQLRKGGFQKALGAAATLESKTPDPAGAP